MRPFRSRLFGLPMPAVKAEIKFEARIFSSLIANHSQLEGITREVLLNGSAL
jgi:hypothetical protein